MSAEPKVAYQIQPANKLLWTIQTYLELISKNDRLVHGSGLKRLYVMANGIATYYDQDIDDATAKAIKMGLVPHSLNGFMMSSILKNCHLYGALLASMIECRLAEIARGDVVNPNPQINWNPAEGRRFYYLPQHTLIARLQLAIRDDFGTARFDDVNPTVVSLNTVARECEFQLNMMQGSEGYISSTESSVGALIRCVERLVETLNTEAIVRPHEGDYKVRSRSCLKILWFIAKLLYGDLTVVPQRKDINMIDLQDQIRLTDGTLAALPFPIRQTLYIFSDHEVPAGISLKGRAYLNAVSAAAFYRPVSDEG